MKQAIKICNNVYWVGVHDFNLRNFHGSLFPIQDGTSYNAYLIVDKEITLIDTVEEEFMDIMLERIRSVIKNQAIDNVIVQHAEPDHSSGFIRFMKEYPNAKAFASNAGINIMMKQYFNDYHYLKLKTNDKLCTGKYTLSFIEMSMIHWPDNMMTYLEEEQILFSNDAFGQHIASYDIFDRYHSFDKLMDRTKDYYANILMQANKVISNKLSEISKLNLSLKFIAPAHGVIWVDHIEAVLDAYSSYANCQNVNKAVIVYDSVWNHTRSIAEAFGEGLGRNGICVKVYKVSETSNALIFKEILDAKAVFVGSGTYNNSVSPEIAGFLAHLSTLKITNKIGFAFGSYGWYNQACKNMSEQLATSGITLYGEGSLNVNYAPTEDDLDNIVELGASLSDVIKNM
ncbi:MAG: FprA family A-type flavoprotein [Erysipelotrichaceae bacterium]